MDVSQLLSPSDVAALLDVPRRRVIRMRHLPRVVLGTRTIKYDPADVAAFIAHRHEPGVSGGQQR